MKKELHRVNMVLKPGSADTRVINPDTDNDTLNTNTTGRPTDKSTSAMSSIRISDASGNHHADSRYRNLINKYLKYIESQCRRAIGKKWDDSSDTGLNAENESLELFNKVLDKLKEKNFKVLKQYKGNAKLSTYITAIISNQAVDMIRRKKGRGREKERAKKLGPLGEQIYETVFVSAKAISTAYAEIRSQGIFTGSLAEFDTIVDKIRGKGKANVAVLDDPVVKKGTQNLTSGELIVVDNRSNPEDLVIEGLQEKKRKEVLSAILSALTGEERLIIRMRFPTRPGEKPQDIERIAEVLGISKKAVYNRIPRILAKCRDMVTRSGVQINDLF